MLSKFGNEVLSKGAEAVLPQNLSSFWLDVLLKISEDFLDSSFSLDECNDPKDVADPILSTCVYEILRHRHAKSAIVPIEEMIEKMAVYAISIIMESIDRESGIGLISPSLENILSIDRITAYKAVNPDFVDMLEKACIIRDSKKGWFDSVKEKILSRF